MRKIAFLIVLICGFIPLLWASDNGQQKLTRQEFRARQQSFITERAGLTAEEASKFFPLYFELQDRKKELNGEAWKLMREGREKDTAEDRYGEIMEGVLDARIESDKLEKEYLKKFQKILSNKKIYLIQRAEMRFHRELLKGMKGDKNHNPKK